MRFGWYIPLPGPFSLGGTIWRSKKRGYHGTLPGWTCSHNHRSREAALECARKEARRRERNGC